MWGTQLQGSHIPYKVWGNHKSHWQLQGSRSGVSLPSRTEGSIKVANENGLDKSIVSPTTHKVMAA